MIIYEIEWACCFVMSQTYGGWAQLSPLTSKGVVVNIVMETTTLGVIMNARQTEAERETKKITQQANALHHIKAHTYWRSFNFSFSNNFVPDGRSSFDTEHELEK